MRRFQLAIAACLILFFQSVNADANFPKPNSLVPAVEFWKKVYTQATTRQGFLHDKVNMAIVYGKVSLKSKGRRGQNKEIKAVLANHRAALRSLSKGKRKGLSKLEQDVLNAWGKNTSNASFKAAIKRVRFQRGQSNKFKAGLVRSGAHLKSIQKVFGNMGLPLRLAALPHVESSYNASAYSHVGAAGMWQFMRSTGRRFMRVDHVVDERLDVNQATRAAAELLKHNYSVLKSWPLALTAYNHGLAGMRRAVAKTGGSDIGKIVKTYKGRTFGFASRNFYAAFLAASEIAQTPRRYFSGLVYNKPTYHPRVTISKYLPSHAAASQLGISASQLKTLNPALRATVWQGEKYIPKGYVLRLSNKYSESEWRRRVAKTEQTIGLTKQKPDHYYRVQRGDSLSTIARHYKTGVTTLMALNNIRSKHRIRIGQRLRLPGASASIAAATKTSQKKPAKPVVIAGANTYKVRAGDTLSQIAQRHGVSVKSIRSMNYLNKRSVIKPGQLLTLRQGDKKQPAAVIASANVAKPEPVTSEQKIYQVKSGDTLSGIALRHQIHERDLLNLNGLSKRTIIKPGQKLKLKTAPVAVASVNSSVPSIHKIQVKKPNEIVLDKIAALEPAISNDVKKSDKNGKELDEADVDNGSLVEAQSDLSADPSDYQVAKNNTIEVQVIETLGHYADWLEIKTSSLRKLNKIRYGKAIVVGKRIKLNFKNVSKADFVHRRENFHLANQSTYFDTNTIVGVCTHKVRRGDSLWDLATTRYRLPFWLLRQYNPNITLESVLSRGQELQIPLIRDKSGNGANPIAKNCAGH